MSASANIFSVSAVLGMLVLFVGCNFLNNLTKFPIDYSSTFTIPQGIPPNIPYDVYTPYFATNSAKYFSDNKTSSDLIEGCVVKSIIASVNGSSQEDFSFISSIHIFLLAHNLPTKELAYKNNIPDNVGDTLQLDVQDVELIDYIKKDSLGLRIQVLTDRVNISSLPTKVNVQFLVDAKILGI